MEESVSCYICKSGFIHVKWLGEEHVLSREMGWLSHDLVYSDYHPVYHPCVNCSKQSRLCKIGSIIMEFVDRLIAVGLYYSKEEFGSVTNLLSQWVLKFKKDPRYADPLGCALSEVISRYWLRMLDDECDNIIISPVPKHSDEGEYNQAWELAKVVQERLKAKKLDVKFAPNLVIKTEPTKAGDRRNKCKNLCKDDEECFTKCNFNEAFRILKIENSLNIKEGCVIVIDDVKTTGATVGAMAKLLKDKGAYKVFVAALARDAIKRELLNCIPIHILERHEYFIRGHEK